MSVISKPYTFSTGATIVAAEHNSNFDTIYQDYNGNITNANIVASANIADTKLAQIATASKVSGTALTGLASTPALAGALPIANIPIITVAKGGLGKNIGALNQGDILYDDGVSGFSRLTPGTSGYILKTNGANQNPVWANALFSVLDYGSSASASTERGTAGATLKIAFGTVAVTGTQNITNLGFTSSSSYVAVATVIGAADANEVIHTNIVSASSFTIVQANNKSVYWIAIGT